MNGILLILRVPSCPSSIRPSRYQPVPRSTSRHQSDNPTSSFHVISPLRISSAPHLVVWITSVSAATFRRLPSRLTLIALNRLPTLGYNSSSPLSLASSRTSAPPIGLALWFHSISHNRSTLSDSLSRFPSSRTLASLRSRSGRPRRLRHPAPPLLAVRQRPTDHRPHPKRASIRSRRMLERDRGVPRLADHLAWRVVGIGGGRWCRGCRNGG